MKFKIPLVPNARKLLNAWSVQAAIIGAVLPDVLQLIADNSGFLPWFDSEEREVIRIGCLIAVVVLRPILQGDGLEKPGERE